MSGRRQGEIAAYSIIEMMMIEHGEPLEIDVGIFARRCGMPNGGALQKALDGLIKAQLFFVTEDGRLWSQTAEAEIAFRGNKTARGADAAYRRWGKKDNNISDSGMQSHDIEIEQEIKIDPPVAQLRGAGRNGIDSGNRKACFNALWNDWPKDYRPRSRGLAESLFVACSEENRRKLTGAASAYIDAMTRRKKTCPLMIPFLRGAWREFVDAPEIDEDGDFVITSDREEWIPWIEQLRRDHGEAGVTSTMKLPGGPRIVRRQRWPGNEASSPAQEQRAQGGSTR